MHYVWQNTHAMFYIVTVFFNDMKKVFGSLDVHLDHLSLHYQILSFRFECEDTVFHSEMSTFNQRLWDTVHWPSLKTVFLPYEPSTLLIMLWNALSGCSWKWNNAPQGGRPATTINLTNYLSLRTVPCLIYTSSFKIMPQYKVQKKTPVHPFPVIFPFIPWGPTCSTVTLILTILVE